MEVKVEEEEDENTDLEQINEYNRRHKISRIYYLIFTTSLFFFTVDPFAIYKSSSYSRSTAARYQQYQLVTLKIQPNHGDRLFGRWRFCIHLYSGYLFIKFTTLVIVQLSLPVANDEDATMNEKKEQGLIASLGHLLGNPFNVLPGVTLFAYGLLAIGLAYVVLYLFHYLYLREPFDSSQLRLWLEPSREFRRVDINILETLNYLDTPFEPTCHCTTGGKRRKYSIIGPDQVALVSREIQSRTIGLLRRRYWHFRPVVYTLGWYETINRFGLFISVPIVAAVTLFSIGAFPPLLGLVLTVGPSGELAWPQLSAYQVVSLLEIIITVIFVLPMCLFELILFLGLCFSQLIILDNVRHHLVECLADLRRMNCYGYNTIDPVAAICILLQPLIKTHHSLDELRNNTRFLTQMVSINVVISSSSCILIHLAEYLDGEDLANFRLVIIGFHWLWTNALLLSCAYIFTRALKLETITWSMLAELRNRESRDDWLMYEFQVAELWRRLIISRCFSEPRMSVRPFGITLNYDRALQLNYLAISLASILKSF